ncbi:MAG TPA: (deoxy)nucleoside triphosphate pyrophosphohydrolase [Pantanalinema sp.]
MHTPIEVVGAIIRRGDRVLIAQRPPGKHEALLWEFPGGKVEPGESPEACLAREIREELDAEIAVGAYFGDVLHDYGGRRIHLTCYWATLTGSEPRAIECHALAWVSASELGEYAFAPADVPLVARLGVILG